MYNHPGEYTAEYHQDMSQQQYQEEANYGQQDPAGYRNQHSIEVAPGSRPFVDVNATGQVDPNMYPEPKDSTHKVRGKSEFLQMIFDVANQELLLAKIFYFFFYSAFGSLFPLMAVYFKQMGMNSGQCGILIGVRPFVEFLSTPFWTGLADKYQRGKTMLMCAICCWIFFTMMLSFCQPVATACIVSNSTHYLIREERISKRSLDYQPSSDNGMRFFVGHNEEPHSDTWDLLWLSNDNDDQSGSSRSKRSTIRGVIGDHVIGQSPRSVSFVSNYDKERHGMYRAPPFSSIVYNVKDIQKVFFLTFMLVALGEFFSSPAITLADSVILGYLGEEADHYGQQRMFGSIGWGLAMFFVGIALDHSTSFPNHPCEPHAGERNYTICFATFSVLMGCALITSSQFKFDYTKKPEEVEEQTAEEKYDASVPPVRDWQKPQPEPARSQTDTIREAMKNLPQLKSRVFANTITKLPEWTVVLKDLKNLRCMAFIFVAWWMGLGMGLIFGFLFWHLQDFGGTPSLFGIASVINHISEICAYFFCFRLINQYGHVKILCLGLLANVLRFLYISWLTNPWWVLPFELVQGITHATTWAACVSFLNHSVPNQRSSANGVLQVIQHALGKGFGAIFGGALINNIGSQMTFRLYGFLSLVVLLFFIFVNFYKKDVGFQTNLDPSEDPRQMADEGGALAPHGVPASPMPRALSSNKLNDQDAAQQEGHVQMPDGSLGVPGGVTNPFAPSGGGGGGGYDTGGYNYSNVNGQFGALGNQQTIRSNPFLNKNSGSTELESTRVGRLQESHDNRKYNIQVQLDMHPSEQYSLPETTPTSVKQLTPAVTANMYSITA